MGFRYTCEFGDDIVVKKFPFWYFYSFTEIISKVFDHEGMMEILTSHVKSNIPIWKTIDGGIPVPKSLKEQCASANITNARDRFRINAIQFVYKKENISQYSEKELALLVDKKYFNQIKHHIRLEIVRIKGINPSDIPRLDDAITWKEIVDAVNLSFLKENGIFKTTVLCIFKRIFN